MATKWISATFILLNLLLIPHTIALPRLNGEIESREICYNDDVLWSFQYWSRDSIPYCSSLLRIQDRTITVDPVTSYATESTVVTTEYDDPTDTVTIPQVTVFSTTTTTVAHIWRRRPNEEEPICGPDDECTSPPEAITINGTVFNYTEPATLVPPPTLIAPGPPFTGILQSTNPGPTPITANPVPSILADCSTNASIASYVFSACSCLRLKPKTVDVTPTVQTTRTVSGIDYEAQPSVVGGTTTVIVTSRVLPSIVGPPVAKTSFTTPGAFTPSGIIIPTFKPSEPIYTFSPPTGTAVRTFLSTGVTSYPPSGFISPILPPTEPGYSFNFPTGTAGSSLLSTGATLYQTSISRVILPTEPGYSFNFPTGTAGPSFLSTGATSYPPSGNISNPVLPPSPPISSFPFPPTVAPGTRTQIDITPSRRPRPSASGTGRSNASSNVTTEVSAIIASPSSPPVPLRSSRPAPPPFSEPGGSRAGFDISSQTSAPSSTGTGLANSTVGTSAGTASPQPSVLPIGNSIDPRGCPTINNTIYTDKSVVPPQRYQIQCFRAYTGPSFLGLAEPDAKSCIAECDKVNHGFSLLECYGVTWLKYAGDAASVRCLLKTRGGLLNFTTDTLALSAVLLDDVPQPITGAFNPPPKEINGTWYPS